MEKVREEAFGPRAGGASLGRGRRRRGAVSAQVAVPGPVLAGGAAGVDAAVAVRRQRADVLLVVVGEELALLQVLAAPVAVAGAVGELHGEHLAVALARLEAAVAA